MARAQRITIIIKPQLDGNVNVSMSHFPKLPPNEEKFNNLSHSRKVLVNAAFDISRYIIECLKRDRKTDCQTSEDGV